MIQLEIDNIRKKAYSVMNVAIKKGQLKRMPCEVCGKIKTHAHHEDYNEPLNVIWLCQPHHMKRHTEIRNGIHYRTHIDKPIDIDLAFKFSNYFESLGESKSIFRNKVIADFDWSSLLFDKKLTGKSYITNPERILLKTILEGYGIEF